MYNSTTSCCTEIFVALSLYTATDDEIHLARLLKFGMKVDHADIPNDNAWNNACIRKTTMVRPRQKDARGDNTKISFRAEFLKLLKCPDFFTVY